MKADANEGKKSLPGWLIFAILTAAALYIVYSSFLIKTP